MSFTREPRDSTTPRCRKEFSRDGAVARSEVRVLEIAKKPSAILPSISGFLPCLAQQVAHIRSRFHLQLRRNPLQSYGCLGPQPPGRWDCACVTTGLSCQSGTRPSQLDQASFTIRRALSSVISRREEASWLSFVPITCIGSIGFGFRVQRCWRNSAPCGAGGGRVDKRKTACRPTVQGRWPLFSADVRGGAFVSRMFSSVSGLGFCPGLWGCRWRVRYRPRQRWS